MIRVVLVDDHTLLREGTRTLLQAAGDIQIVAETGSGEEALALARRLRPDVLLLDIRLDGMTGIEVARTLRQELATIKLLILSAYAYEPYVRALFAVGVHGYLLKSASGAELIAATRAVCRGEQVLSEEIAARRPSSPAQDGSGISGALSTREREALNLAYQGASNREIAQHLQIGIRTAESYLSHAMAKLGARSRTEAIHLARQQGILPPE